MRWSALNPKQLAAEASVTQKRVSDRSRVGFTAAVALAAGLLAILWIAPAHAQSHATQYIPTVWTTEQGLPQNSVNALLQEYDGYLWIGTFGGLARFDGERFKVFDLMELPALGSLRITSLYESRSRVLWIGTAGGGVTRLQNGVAATYTEHDGLPSGFINSIRADAEGNIWINTSGGLARFGAAKPEACPKYRGKAVREFYLQARDGSMWFRYGKQILRFAADGSVATLDVPNPSVFLVHEAGDGSVWIAVRDEYRLIRYTQGRFSDVPLPPIERRKLKPDYRENAVVMARGASGDLLLLTPAGLVRTAGGTLTPPEALTLPADGGELPKVRSLLVDREGNLWVGTVGAGLIRLRPAPLTAYGKSEGLSDKGFNAVFQDREGRIWLGGDLLYWFDGGRFHLFPGVPSTVAIRQTQDGDLWFGGYGGLYRWRSGVLSHFTVDAPAVSAVYQDREGTIWIGAAKENRPGGLYRFAGGEWRQVPGVSDVRQIVQDRESGFWVTGSEGLWHVRGGKPALYQTSQSLPGRIRDICQDPTRDLWLATYGGGLFRLRDGRLNAITKKDGLPNDVLVGVLDDGRGNLWVSSNQNIFRLSLNELNDFADGKVSSVSPVSYGVDEGMRTSECNGGSPAIWKTTDGRIWVSTLRGVVAIDPSAGSRLPPPVVVEEARANQSMLARDGLTSAPGGSDMFDFRFTALSLSAPEKVRFKYRLEPYDKNWVEAGAQRTAHYTNMAPGEYSFQVIAANSFGIWNSQGDSVRFVLRPRFNQTNWFYALCTAASLALLWMAYQFRLRQLQHQFDMRLDERVQERTRIARELHDTLLQSFHGLLFRFQAARNLFPRRPEEALHMLDSAIARAEGALAEGRDAIQDLRAGSSESRLEDLLNSAGQELAGAQEENGNSAVFQMSMEGQPRSLSPLMQDEIYRMAREILRNAFQHAHASRIEAAVQYNRKLFRLRIRDDGKGIDSKVLEAGARAGHWGLPGIRERAKRIGAQLRLWSESGAGTEVELTLPARIAYPRGGPGHGLQLFRKRKVNRED